MKLPVLLSIFALTSWAQEFEVASLKPAPKPTLQMIAAGQVHFRRDDARFEESNVSLGGLITVAYQMNWDRISGPSWINDQFYAIAAALPPGSKKEQIPEMLRKLLADRFKLQVHHEDRVQSAYVLTVTGKEPHLKPASGDAGDQKGCMSRPGQLVCRQMTLAQVAENLSSTASAFAAMPVMPLQPDDPVERRIDAPVIDQTGLNGPYDIDLQWVPLAGLPSVARGRGANFPQRDSSVKATSIFAAFEAVGLKLQPGKHAFDFLVVDHAERVPAEN